MHKNIWLAMLFNLFEAFKMYKKNCALWGHCQDITCEMSDTLQII